MFLIGYTFLNLSSFRLHRDFYSVVQRQNPLCSWFLPQGCCLGVGIFFCLKMELGSTFRGWGVFSSCCPVCKNSIHRNTDRISLVFTLNSNLNCAFYNVWKNNKRYIVTWAWTIDDKCIGILLGQEIKQVFPLFSSYVEYKLSVLLLDVINCFGLVIWKGIGGLDCSPRNHFPIIMLLT